MAFSGLTIEDEIYGLPRQPVPLRLVPLITGWSVHELFQHLTDRIEDRYELLTAYDYQAGNSPAQIRPSTFNAILSKSSVSLTSSENIKLINSRYFVWSDDLTKAFTDYIDYYIGRETAHRAGLRLLWNPPLDSAKSLIDSCPDFKNIAPVPTRTANSREKRKNKTQEIYRLWYEEDKNIQQSNSRFSANDRAREIVRKKIGFTTGKKEPSVDHVRKMVREMRNKLGK